MRFRKLVLCLLVGILIFGFSSTNTYAAEGTVLTEDSTTINTTTDITTTGETEVLTDNTQINSTEETVTADDAILDATTETSVEDATTATEEVTEEATEEVTVDSDKEDTDKEDTAKEDKKEVTVKAKVQKVVKESDSDEEENYTKAELRLLSALIYCEANGESYQGKLAVAIVVMNRQRSGAFPDTVKAVIYQKYQFGPVRNGSLDNALDAYDDGNFTSTSEKECIKAAKAALSGTKSITVNGEKKNFSKYLYFSGSLSNDTFKLGNHEFK
jgi:N-acetylmuramoyl-L-alanine amidase